jgi:methoxymalonate biosynthesis acyl carrier protein
MDELVEQLREHFSAMTSTNLGPDDDYFALGLVNSLRALEIVVYIERTFEITIDVDDLALNNFRTAAAAAAFVSRKRVARSGAETVS